ncbi:MAG: nucleoid occlusion protein [Erysipelothrix sp.]|nr:nucleoid occlusion protein [Erysipelothrix sp.]
MSEIVGIDIDQIVSNPFQPRTYFDETQLFELAQSIRMNGLLQPIVVRPKDKRYEIIAGERRYRACILAGYTQVSCVVKQVDDNAMANLSLIENIQREDLSVIEEAVAYQNLLSHQSLTQQELASILGKSQSTIANKIRLLKLDEKVIDALKNKKISERHGRALLSLSHYRQEQAVNEIIKKDLNVKETEELAKRLSKDIFDTKPRKKGINRDLRIAVNTIEHSVKMVQDMGINTSIKKITSEEGVQLIIHIKKGE